MGITTDRNDPELREIEPDGQQKSYLVLSAEERAKGFVRPVRDRYRHRCCRSITTMGLALAETYARQPDFYSGTFCCACGAHFPLVIDGVRQFEWVDRHGTPDGSYVGE